MTQQAGVALVYLMKGFDGEYKGWKGHRIEDDMYEEHANKSGGHVGIVSDMYEYAEFIETHLESAYKHAEHDGVIQYELYETFGAWIFRHPFDDFSSFKLMAMQAIGEWFAEEQKASLPVDAPRKESTMKISDLISRLASLRGDLGDVDVIVRGSRETSFVDAMEIRKVKTPKRVAVYIGKAPQQTPQE